MLIDFHPDPLIVSQNYGGYFSKFIGTPAIQLT